MGDHSLLLDLLSFPPEFGQDLLTSLVLFSLFINLFFVFLFFVFLFSYTCSGNLNWTLEFWSAGSDQRPEVSQNKFSFQTPLVFFSRLYFEKRLVGPSNTWPNAADIIFCPYKRFIEEVYIWQREKNTIYIFLSYFTLLSIIPGPWKAIHSAKKLKSFRCACLSNVVPLKKSSFGCEKPFHFVTLKKNPYLTCPDINEWSFHNFLFRILN